MGTSTIHEAFKGRYEDQYCLLFVRGISDDSLFVRLGIDSVKSSFWTLNEALQHYASEPGNKALRVLHAGEWTVLLELYPSGDLFAPEVVSALSEAGEVVGAWHLLDSTTKVVHAEDGRVLGYFDDWLSLVKGAAPERLVRALGHAGVLEEDLDDEETDEELSVPVAVLLAIEEEFGLRVSRDSLDRSSVTVELP
ncbi:MULTISPECIES: DUF6461 domain-containing protein [Streptomyces]|jgi:hypothetical protein|uniref:DUF6461 domain-containing protein n=1 Tax=Streptomyces griseoaurantiacus TaxID=68213 RepID=A0ABZ1V4I0_9ACTN|nr:MULTISPECIES: DUF6461 domain-containing protein [Streptomyces]MDX3359764.1 DUF6461 domain-containing protein [Streptomyces sp. ME02-6978.2a]WTI27534.1 DUF6461 domain-containing protein [Streptomyces jietaisiensis]